MNNTAVPRRLPIDVAAALHAICSTGKGRCWHCDEKLPAEAEAQANGWDVQRFDEQPVASIVLVCPECRRRKERSEDPQDRISLPALAASRRAIS